MLLYKLLVPCPPPPLAQAVRPDARITCRFFLHLKKGSRGDDGCGAGGRTFLGHNRARVDTCVAGRRQTRRPAHVPVFHHHPARRHDRARTQGGTKEHSAPTYILGARKSRIHRLQTIRDCAPR